MPGNTLKLTFNLKKTKRIPESETIDFVQGKIDMLYTEKNV